MIDYKLAKQLKDAGFPQSPYSNQLCSHNDGTHNLRSYVDPECEWASVPDLSQLIEACGDGFMQLQRRVDGGFHCMGGNWDSEKKKYEFAFMDENIPEEAVAKLWLELNKK